MIICDITQGYAPMSGGIKTYIHYKQKYIKQQNRDRHILIIPGEQDGLEEDGPCKIYTIKSPGVPHCEPFRFMLRLDKVLDILFREKPHIVELDNAYLAPYPALYYRMRRKSALIGYYHTDFPTAYVETYMKRIVGTNWARMAKEAGKQYARFIYNQFDCTIAASQQMSQALKGMGIQGVHQVPLGIDLELFHPSKRNPQIRQQLGLRDDDLLLIYVGRLDPEKRIDFILNAFEKVFPQWNSYLLLIGEGSFKDNLVNYTRVNPRVKYIPYIQNRENLARILASADMYITAGPYETFALSVVEAQACGLPVVGVKAGALIERVPEEVGALVDPYSTDAMAESISALRMNGFREKGKQARKLIENTFSWEKSFRKLFDLYETSIY